MESGGLHVVDWIIFAVMLLLSTGIGRFLILLFISKLKMFIIKIICACQLKDNRIVKGIFTQKPTTILSTRKPIRSLR